VDWTYREFIAQEQRVLGNPAAKAHFAAMLADAPVVQLPRLKASGAERSRGRVVVEPFTALSGRLLGLAQRMGVPVQSVLLAAHFKVLSTLSGQRRTVSCVTHNGRPETAGAERSLGLFLNFMPLSLDVAPGSWRELIDRTTGIGMQTLEYRTYPLATIQQDLDWPFSEVLFNYTHFHIFNALTTNAAQPLEALGGAAFEQTNFDLMVDMSRGVNDNSILLAMTYNAKRLDNQLIALLELTYMRAFEAMLEGLDEPHDAKSLLSGAEVQQL
jgi:non-ribosomal peptide synthetase component F